MTLFVPLRFHQAEELDSKEQLTSTFTAFLRDFVGVPGRRYNIDNSIWNARPAG